MYETYLVLAWLEPVEGDAKVELVFCDRKPAGHLTALDLAARREGFLAATAIKWSVTHGVEPIGSNVLVKDNAEKAARYWLDNLDAVARVIFDGVRRVHKIGPIQ